MFTKNNEGAGRCPIYTILFQVPVCLDLFEVPRDAHLSASQSLSPDKTGGLRPRHFQPMEDNPSDPEGRSQTNTALSIGPTTCQ